MTRLFTILCAITLLTGCVSLIPEPHTPNALYSLGAIEGPQPHAFSRSVLIRQPEAPRLLSGVEMSTRDAEGGIRLIRGAEWADRAPRLLQLSLLDYLAAGDTGLALSPNIGARAELELNWRLSEFVLLEKTALAQAELTLLDSKTRKVIAQRVVTSRHEARNSDPGSRAQALAASGRDLVRQAADFIATAP